MLGDVQRGSIVDFHIARWPERWFVDHAGGVVGFLGDQIQCSSIWWAAELCSPCVRFAFCAPCEIPKGSVRRSRFTRKRRISENSMAPTPGAGAENFKFCVSFDYSYGDSVHLPAFGAIHRVGTFSWRV